MLRITLAVMTLVIIVIAALYARERAYYRTLLSTKHLREVYDRFVIMLPCVQKPTASEASWEPVGFITSAGLVLAVTSRSREGQRAVHVSISQQGRPTTTAVAKRFAFFVLCVVNRGEFVFDAYETESRVHHLVITSTNPVQPNTFEIAAAMYLSRQNDIPLTFRFQKSGLTEA